MEAVDLPKEREYCNCPARHTKGRCDSDFPANTYSLSLTPTQLKMQYEARKQLGSLRPWEKDPFPEVSVTKIASLSVTCTECGNLFVAARSTAKFCSDACRKRNSRDLG